MIIAPTPIKFGLSVLGQQYETEAGRGSRSV
jgi:hypothetical protein